MIQLEYCNGGILVFNADDWSALRKTHRILGTLIGSTVNNLEALPLKLLPEEALLLVDKGIAKIVDREFKITSEVKEKYGQFENELLVQEKVSYREKRKKQLESMIDSIVAAKRKKGDIRSPEEILNAELEKSCQVTKENMLWPILMEPIYPPSKITDISRDVVFEQTTELKYAVFKDLWEKGYYITDGFKFGGDFLVYLGDPVAYHAIFIVHCVNNPNQSFHSTEVVAFGRLATAVKKRAVLASFNEDKIVAYITINWIDS